MNQDAMRPEYIDAVSRVAFGAGFWVWLLMPPLLIVAVFFFRPYIEKSSWRLLNLLVLGFSFVFFWGFGVYHAHEVQRVKRAQMETTAEMNDFQ